VKRKARAARTRKMQATPRTKGPIKTPTRQSNIVIAPDQFAQVIPGQVFLGDGDIVALEGRATVDLTVSNLGDRPIQVGSHCHFFEVNRALRFEREKAFGFRLQVPAGTAVRFEPGEEKRVTLVAIGGKRIAYGGNGLTQGRLDDAKVRASALRRAAERGFMETSSKREKGQPR
jgi:urease beta subunit